ncbi:unnamed protein product, partial [Mesorhabditis spiculigera]
MGGGPAPTYTGKRIPIIPDGGWGWVVVFGSFMIHVIADGFVYSFGVVAEKLIDVFKSDNTMSAMTIALLTGLTLGAGPIASALTNKWGCRTVCIIGSVIAAIGCLISSWANSMGYLSASVGIIMGFGFGLMYCPAIVIVTTYFEKRRALATGITVCGAGVGSAAFGPINNWVIQNYGWRAVFVTFTGAILTCILYGATFRPIQFREDNDEEEKKALDESKEENGNIKEDAALLSPPIVGGRLHSSSSSQIDKSGTNSLKGSKHSISLSQVNGEPRSRSGTVSSATGYLQKKDVFYTGSVHNLPECKDNPDYVKSITSLNAGPVENEKGVIASMLNSDLLRDKAFWIFAISNLMTSVGFNSPLYFLPLHGNKGLGLTPEASAVAITYFGVFNTIGRLLFGLIGDLGGANAARNRMLIYIGSLAFCGVLTSLSYLFSSYALLCAYAGLFGLSISSYVCLTSVILVDLLGIEKLTNAFGLLLLFQGIGTVFGPPLSGYLADSFNSYHPAFIFCGVNLALSGVMLLPLLKKTRPAEQAKHLISPQV